MSVTTEYGHWGGITGDGRTVEEAVAAAVDADGFDLDGIAADYREAINAALPEGVALRGDVFYGPYPPQPVDLRAAVDSVDFDAIVARHDLEANS